MRRIMPRHLLSSFMVTLVFCRTLEGSAAAAPPRLVGLLWGGDDPELGIVGVFSPLENP